MSSQRSIVLGDRTIELGRELLINARGEIVPLRPRAWLVLRLLATRAGQLVSKDEIMDEVWPDCEVTEDSLVHAIGDVRRALGNSNRSALRTLPRRGYILTISGDPNARADLSIAATLVPPEPGGPAISSEVPRLSIVVLPFVNLGGDPEHEHFVDGVTESLTTDLSRIAGALVIARSTAFTFKGKAADVREIGRELNVRYLLEGSVQCGSSRFRLNVRLTDTQTENCVWADRFDKQVADLLDMQDEIVSRLANTLNTELINFEARRAERSLRPDAVDLYFQGRAFLHKGVTSVFMAKARDFFERALALDPDSIEAAVAAAQVDVSVGSSFMTDDGPIRFHTAENVLNSVLLRAPNHPRAHMLLGAVKIRTGRAADGVAECYRALALDRNLADAHGFIGLGKYVLERGEDVEGHILDALRLSPRDTRAFLWLMFVGMANLMIKTDVEALRWLRRSIEANPNHALSHFHLAGALAMMGELKAARSSAETGLALDHSFTIRRYRTNVFRFEKPQWVAGLTQLYEGMRKAGIPEG